MPLPNLYNLGNLPQTTDPQTRRVFQDLVDRINYLTNEIDVLKGRDIEIVPSMAALKENPVEGVITIPYRDHGGQDGFIRVSPHGVIKSYSNPGESIFPYVDVRTIGNVGGGLDSLHSVTIPAGTLRFDGDYLDVHCAGLFGAVGAFTRRWRFSIDAQTIRDISSPTTIEAFSWDARLIILRIGPTTVRVRGSFIDGAIFDDATNEFLGATLNPPDTTVANMNSSSMIFLVQGEHVGGSTNDVVKQDLTEIRLYRRRTLVTI